MAKKVVLACELCQSRNYSTQKNKDNNTNRLRMKKFCQSCNAHTLHRETK